MKEWGREDTTGRWMTKWPVGTLGALVLAAAAAWGAWQAQVVYALAPVQRQWLSTYVQSTIATAVHRRTSRYTTGVSDPGTYDNRLVRDQLQQTVFGGMPVTRLLVGPAATGGITFMVLLCWAVPLDRARRREREQVRRSKGPVLLPNREFARLVHGGSTEGIPFPQTQPTLWSGDRPAPPLIVPSRLENQHMAFVGGTGNGKTTLLEMVLDEVERRGETAVVYDPSGHFVRKYWMPERGDVHLNPLHVGCPYWRPGDEVRRYSEAPALAEALIPHKPGEVNTFFPDSARIIFAHLLQYSPSVAELLAWLSDQRALVALLRKSDLDLNPIALDDILADEAPAQKSGVMGSLNIAAQSLRLCPSTDDFGQWSATAWAKERRGWIFLTNTPTTRASLVPLQTLWLDSIILRLMEGHGRSRPVKLVMDELPTLKRVPHAPTVLAEGRKFNISTCIGYQDASQLEHLYGIEARAMIAQPYTKFFLGLNHPEAAKHASDTIGEVEVEHLRESRNDGGWFRPGTRTLALERHREPLVMPSEISGLRPMRGYLKYGNLVTPLRFTFAVKLDRCPGIIEREPEPARIVPVAPPPGPPPAPSVPRPGGPAASRSIHD